MTINPSVRGSKRVAKLVAKLVMAGFAACFAAPAVHAQSTLSAYPDGPGSGLVGYLGAGLVVALIAAIFWNRRLAHEKRERRRLEQRLADLAAPLTMGLFEARAFPDGEIRLLFSNKAARDLLRLDNRELVVKLDDQIISSYLHADDESRIRQSIKRSIESLEPIDETFRYMSPDGQYRWLQADIQVRVMDDGGVIWTGGVRDLTAERTQNERIHYLTSSKDLFFAAASHELRTPVHSIGLALEQIALDNKQTHSIAMQSARQATELLGILLDDLLELARVQPDELILKPSGFSLVSLLEALAQDFRIALEHKSIKFILSIDKNVPDSLVADPQRLQQILANLIVNALRFSHGGEVTISVSAPDEETNPTEVARSVNLQFAVSDHGEGIAPDQLERVFEPFITHQAVTDDALALRTLGQQKTGLATTGTGLGLAICRQIVNRMGGRIWLDSVPGRGTAARFKIPVERSAGLATAPERTRPGVAHSKAIPAIRPGKNQFRKRRNVLLVDDDRLGRTLMATLLSSEGYLVTQAGTGEEAFNKFSQGEFDAVVTDLRMPGMDGETLAARIRALSESALESDLKQVPELPSRNMGLTQRPRLIALTASLGGGDVTRRADELFDDRLQKPVGVDQLVDVLET